MLTMTWMWTRSISTLTIYNINVAQVTIDLAATPVTGGRHIGGSPVIAGRATQCHFALSPHTPKTTPPASLCYHFTFTTYMMNQLLFFQASASRDVALPGDAV